jgi:cytidine deaminase
MTSRPDLDGPVAEARLVAGRAHAPYSGFRVGAVIEDGAGRLHVGCNVECASLGLSICAERSALGAAIARGSRGFRRIWIYTPTPRTTPPCGACRAMLAAIAPRIEIVLVCDRGVSRPIPLARLLPGSVPSPRRFS